MYADFKLPTCVSILSYQDNDLSFTEFRRWALDSYNWYKRNCNMEMAPTMGISSISGYWLSDKDSIDVRF